MFLFICKKKRKEKKEVKLSSTVYFATICITNGHHVIKSSTRLENEIFLVTLLLQITVSVNAPLANHKLKSTMIKISKAFINQKLFLSILFIGPELTINSCLVFLLTKVHKD